MSHSNPRRRPAAPRADQQATAAVAALVDAILTGAPVDEAALRACDPQALHAAVAALKAGAAETFPDAEAHASTALAWSPALARRLSARGRR